MYTMQSLSLAASSPALTRGCMLPGTLLTEAFLEMVQPAPRGTATLNWRSTSSLKAFLLGLWQFYSSDLSDSFTSTCTDSNGVWESLFAFNSKAIFWPTWVNQAAFSSFTLIIGLFFLFNVDILTLVTESTCYPRLAKLSLYANTLVSLYSEYCVSNFQMFESAALRSNRISMLQDCICGGVTLNKNKRDTPLLYHVSKGNNAWPGRVPPPPSRESPGRLPSVSETRPLPPQVSYDGPSLSSSWPIVALTRPPALWRGILFCCTDPRLDHVLQSCGACVIFAASKAYVLGGSEKVTRGAAESSQSQDIGLKKTNHTWP